MLCVCVLGLFIFTFHTSQQRSLLALEATSAGARQQQKRQVLEGGVVTRGRGLTSVVQEGEKARGAKESWEAISNNPHLEQRMKVGGSLGVGAACVVALVQVCVCAHAQVVCCWLCRCTYVRVCT